MIRPGRKRALLLFATATTTVAASIAAAETVNYAYDALGRLRASSTTSGPNNGTNTAVCYDAAGNRERYVTAVGGSAACTPAPYPTSTPSP